MDTSRASAVVARRRLDIIALIIHRQVVAIRRRRSGYDFESGGMIADLFDRPIDVRLGYLGRFFLDFQPLVLLELEFRMISNVALHANGFRPRIEARRSEDDPPPPTFVPSPHFRSIWVRALAPPHCEFRPESGAGPATLEHGRAKARDSRFARILRDHVSASRRTTSTGISIISSFLQFVLPQILNLLSV